MKQISAGQTRYLREHYPHIHIAEVCRQKKSTRKKYFVEETNEVSILLKGYKGV